MNYSDKLKDPRWQKKRLEVFERAGWKCQCCGCSTETLCVHHLKYKGEPWECPDGFLECLCENCHSIRTDFDALFGRSLLPTSLYVIIHAVITGAVDDPDVVKNWKGFPVSVLTHIRKKQMSIEMHEHEERGF